MPTNAVPVLVAVAVGVVVPWLLRSVAVPVAVDVEVPVDVTVAEGLLDGVGLGEAAALGEGDGLGVGEAPGGEGDGLGVGLGEPAGDGDASGLGDGSPSVYPTSMWLIPLQAELTCSRSTVATDVPMPLTW